MKILDIREQLKSLELEYTQTINNAARLVEEAAVNGETDKDFVCLFDKAAKVLEERQLLLEIQAEDIYHMITGTHSSWTN